MALCYWLGRWADGKLGTKFLALVGLILGIGVGFRNLAKAANAMQKEADREALEEERANAAAGTGSPAAPHAPADIHVDASAEAINAKGSNDGDAPS
jgi:hypothetical protein